MKRKVTADFLVKVWRKDGGEQWLLAHIELQAQRDMNLPERMFRYNIRAYDLFLRPVYSLAILADGDADWRPDRFGYGAWRSKLALEYPIVKLLDYAEHQQELETSDNPFALAVPAHLKTLETRGDAEARLEWKLRFARILFARQWQRRQIEELLQFLDWIMSLPDAFEDRFDTEWEKLEREATMAQTMPPIIRRAEERGKRIGALEAKREAVLQILNQRLGSVPEDVRERIEGETNSILLGDLVNFAVNATSFEEFTTQLS